MKYRSKPKIVEATQWWPGKEVTGVGEEPACLRGYDDGYGPQTTAVAARYFVVTIHRQRAYLDPGDWVITEPDDLHHYPCKPDVFADRYEATAADPIEAALAKCREWELTDAELAGLLK